MAVSDDDVYRIFEAARELEPHLREAEVERLTEGNRELRDEVLSLLAFDLGDAAAMQIPGPGAERGDSNSTVPQGLPTRIDGYRIVRKIGEGGMGAVYEAIQEQPKRSVALKLLHASISSKRIKKRQRRLGLRARLSKQAACPQSTTERSPRLTARCGGASRHR